MPPQKNVEKTVPLNLEVQEIELSCRPGCGTSTTSSLCTCPISNTTMGSLFTSKTVS
jgi:hypothetical protein